LRFDSEEQSLPRRAFLDTYPGLVVQIKLDERLGLFAPIQNKAAGAAALALW
jgi:hypothetical protein